MVYNYKYPLWKNIYISFYKSFGIIFYEESSIMKAIVSFINRFSLIQQICVGLVLGVVIAVTSPALGREISILGTIFVGALKGIAPLLVFFLVIAAISKHRSGQQTNMRSIIVLYLASTFLSAAAATAISFMFPTTLHLVTATAEANPPQDIVAVITTLLKNVVDNPVHALMNANYIGILGWAILFGAAARHASESTKEVLLNIADACSKVVRWIISTAPLGIMGLVAAAISEAGVSALVDYAHLLAVLLGTMIFAALVINPFLAFIGMRRNPYPLTFKSLRESGVTAFFTRSSAANIPVNMDLCKRLGVNPDTYTISIPLGATINMGGAAITITIMTLAAVQTLGINVDFATAFLLSVIAAVGACGASGVAGGSLLLIPLACSLFGINNDIAMQVVGVGFIIGVLQDSTETALNSSTDVLFTATADYAKYGYQGDRITAIEHSEF